MTSGNVYGEAEDLRHFSAYESDGREETVDSSHSQTHIDLAH